MKPNSLAKIAIRADASEKIGSGHVVRCLSLAEKLASRGAEIHFFCRHLPPELEAAIRSRGYALTRLPHAPNTAPPSPSLYEDWLEAGWEEDADQTLAALEQVDWLIVDHYSLDEKWEGRLRSKAKGILAIDDLANRSHSADFLLDQNYFADGPARYSRLASSGTTVLSGPRYALLQSKYATAHQRAAERSYSVAHKIFVFFGAVDPGNYSGLALRALAAAQLPLGATVELMIGSMNPHRHELESLAASMSQVRCLSRVSDLSETMLKADIAIGAGGTTAWERCCLGLPTITLTIAENQVAPTKALAETGAIVYVPDANEANLTSAINSLVSSADLRKEMAAKGMVLVDGRGSDRICRLLIHPAVKMRRAEASDCDQIFAWRNHPDTRRYFFDPQELKLEGHRAWFKASIQNKSRALLIGEDTKGAVGVICYDLESDGAKISVYLVPNRRGEGLGAPLLRAGTGWMKEAFPSVHMLKAEVLQENTASHIAFAEAGFRLSGKTYELPL